MNTDTPRTDEWEIDLDNLPLAAALSFADEGSTTGGLLTHAALKTLAAGCRELTAARAEIERLDTAGIHSCHDNCQRPNCVLRRELKAGDNGYGTPTDKAWEMAEQAIAAVEGGSEKPVTLIHNGVGIADMYSRDEFENAMKCTNQTIVSDEAAKQNTKNLS